MDNNHLVTVEFYGIPRQRAGQAELTVVARTVGDMLAAVRHACPGLGDLVSSTGRISPYLRISLDGQRFLENSGEKLAPGDRILILSADAGG